MVEEDRPLGAWTRPSVGALGPAFSEKPMKATRTNDPTTYESTDLEPRDERALSEYLTVLPDYDRARDAPGLFMVVSESGEEYLVDARGGACECPDHEHRGVRCKHLRRVAFATGERPVPVDAVDVDEQLGAHVDATPQVLATDGGEEILVAGDEGEILEDDAEATDADERPADCACPAVDGVDLECWPCRREGFRTPNPDAGEEA